MIAPIVLHEVRGYHTFAVRTNIPGEVDGQEYVGFGVCRNPGVLRTRQQVLIAPRVPFRLGRVEHPLPWLWCRMGWV